MNRIDCILLNQSIKRYRRSRCWRYALFIVASVGYFLLVILVMILLMVM
jgi:hypothetical protein